MRCLVAESTRDVLASADAVIARVRAAIGESHQDDASAETANAYRVADAWNGLVAQFDRERTLADAAKNFREQWPALVRWRDRVLANAKRAKPSVVAAAYESLALECTLAGEYELAAKAHNAAIDVMRRRGRTVPTILPIRSASDDVGAQAQSA